MSTKTKIEWCDTTINPFVGCTKCSPGCENCYAEKIANRFAHDKNATLYKGVAWGEWTGKINFNPNAFDKLPKTPKRVFIGSMTDCFHENIDQDLFEFIYRRITQECFKQHTFIMLTKRPVRMKNMIQYYSRFFGFIPNLWLGVTVCNQQEADEKIPLLLATPAAVRFVSIEPMLDKVNLTHVEVNMCTTLNVLKGVKSSLARDKPINKLDWVICGGETGSKARPTNPDWVRSLRDQCVRVGVPFFLKSLGEYSVNTPNIFASKKWHTQAQRDYNNNIRVVDGTEMYRVGKKAAGNLIDGVEWKQFPEEAK